MAIPLSGANSLFTRWGHIIAGLNEINAHRGAEVNSRYSTVFSDYPAGAQPELVDGLHQQQKSGHVSALGGVAGDWRDLAQKVVVRMASDDVNLDLDLTESLKLVVAQMGAAGIPRPVVAATATPGVSNVGDGSLVASLIDGDGLPLDYVFAEDITFTCTSSAQSGGGTAGQESFAAKGEKAANLLSETWPMGSGAGETVTAVDASENTLIQKGGFNDEWADTNTPPAPWTIQTGVAGTHIVKSNNPFKGNFALGFIGDGSTLTAIYQPLEAADFDPLAVLVAHCRVATTAGSTGTLAMRLVDGSNVVINDEQGTPNAVSVSLASVGTTYQSLGGAFRLPRVLPSVMRFQIILTTALNATEELDIDHVALVGGQRLYAGGPWVGLFSGAANFAQDDSFVLAVTNSHGTGNLSRSLDRLMELRDKGIKIPSKASGAEYPDSVIV